MSHHRGGNVLRCQGRSASAALSAEEDISTLSGWVLSGTTPAWMNAAVWGCARPGTL